MIEVRNLTRLFGETVAVDHVSFGVQQGKVVGFLGPNGAGKTTTLRIITCFLPPTSGAARVDGHDVTTDSLAVRRVIGYLPETVPLYPEMRVREFLEYRARLKGVPRSKRRSRIDGILEKCQIADVARRIVGQLSRGYRQRVGIADALVGDPKLIILDEPTLGLDPNQIRETRKLIKELGHEHTVFLSTHILPEVEMVCDSVVVIHEGRIAAHGTLAELRQKLTAGGGRVLLEIKGPVEQIARSRGAINGVKDVRSHGADGGGHFVVETTGAVDVREEIFDRAARNGWKILEMHAAMATLEDIFTAITMGEGGRHSAGQGEQS